MTGKNLEKLLRLGIVSAVVLLFFLALVLTFQMVCLSQKRKELRALTQTEEEYERLKTQTEDEIELWMQDWKVEEAARKYGYRRN